MMWTHQGKSQRPKQPHKSVVITLLAILVGVSTGCTTTSPVETEPLIMTTQPPKPDLDPPPEATERELDSSPSTPSPEPDQSLLDLREANVIAVTYEAISPGEVRFDVTLLHDDDAEAPSFADRWFVEDLEGNVLGERILAHSHGTQPFTRSATIHIPTEINIVIVRGHDQLHGLGGQSMRVDLGTGEMLAFDEEGVLNP